MTDHIHFEETFEIENIITDFPIPPATEGLPLDPDSHLIRLFDPAGNQVGEDATTPTGSDGAYYQRFAIPAIGPAGEWTVVWTIDVGGEKTPERIRVKVVD